MILILFSGNRQIPGLATGAAGHSLEKILSGMEGKIRIMTINFSRSSFQSVKGAQSSTENTTICSRSSSITPSRFFYLGAPQLFFFSNICFGLVTQNLQHGDTSSALFEILSNNHKASNDALLLAFPTK